MSDTERTLSPEAADSDSRSAVGEALHQYHHRESHSSDQQSDAEPTHGASDDNGHVAVSSATQDYEALSASFAARRDIAAAKRRQPEPEAQQQSHSQSQSQVQAQTQQHQPPAGVRGPQSSTSASFASSAPRTNTIPGRSPVTRKHARGLKPQPGDVHMTARALKSEPFGRGSARREDGAAAWSEPPTDAEVLGRGKLDPNLPPKE